MKNIIESDPNSPYPEKVNVDAEEFLQQHGKEFDSFRERRRRVAAAGGKFHQLKIRIEEERIRLQTLEVQTTAYSSLNFADEIFRNLEATGKPLLELAKNPIFAAAVLLKEHGPAILALEKNKIAALEKELADHISSEREFLKELGAI
ncbi:MAG: hypothetical protein ACREE6_09200 [Limisphaerales bacterium]